MRFIYNTSVVVLRVHHLHPHLHDGLRLLDVLLAGPQIGPGPSDADHHDPPGHVHHHRQHQQLSPARRLHQGLNMIHPLL